MSVGEWRECTERKRVGRRDKEPGELSERRKNDGSKRSFARLPVKKVECASARVSICKPAFSLLFHFCIPEPYPAGNCT